ncbi:MAG TPA: glycosyl hydrolase family 10, partial [Marinilabiliaceae bacterium]|nr:glycosyl hydrolase family 10 [Marinilabiliaceae bacterium]
VWWTQLLKNNDVESDDVTSYFSTEPATGGPNASTIEEGVGVDGSRAIVVRSGDNPVNDWDTQFFVKSSKILPKDAKYKFSMKYRAEKPANASSQAHFNPGEYQHWDFVGQLNFTTEWKTIEASGIVSSAQSSGDKGMMTIAFNLAILKEANTYYFDDISWEIEESGNKMPQTEEEIADTLTYALDNWISGMMTATDGYVKHWDVVNEPISGADTDGDGIYDLWSKDKVSETDATNNFYWADYLGDNYVRLAVKLAREYGPSDLKLFVNDYNLESDWDDNKKLRSLIQWIEQWESDGETVIDGIGTQMHISYYKKPETQASKEEHIVQMFELLAETGKLVRITELDMGIVDENGNAIKSHTISEADHKAMADFYKFIITKYNEIIPAGQRVGITHWCPTDSPSSSSWRGGEPTGLWFQSSNRKHTYAGFADGLSGK